jgi:hypothetical protein
MTHLRNESQTKFLEQISFQQQCWKVLGISRGNLSELWQFVWKIFLWLVFGMLIIMVEMVASGKADNTGQQIYSALLVLGMVRI